MGLRKTVKRQIFSRKRGFDFTWSHFEFKNKLSTQREQIAHNGACGIQVGVLNIDIR